MTILPKDSSYEWNMVYVEGKQWDVDVPGTTAIG